MKTIARSGRNAPAASRILAGILGLLAAAILLAACRGSSGGTDQSYWRNIYGDPDTGLPRCCSHAGRDSDH